MAGDPNRYETRHGATSEVISAWAVKSNAMAACRELRRRNPTPEHGYYVFDTKTGCVAADFLPLKRAK